MKALHVLSIAILVVNVASVASAQRGMRRGGNYNVSTETTLMGTVDNVATIASERRGGGQHITLITASGPIEVHVGPAWYVSSKHVTFTKGDQVTVVGSKVTMDSRDVMLAREIRKGDQVLKLRDASGVPLWARGRGTQ